MTSPPCATRRPIRFKFRPDKLADALSYLAARVTDLTTMKAAKLLYLADRLHLLRYGRPIIGDWYACREHGPVPSSTYDLLQRIRDPEPRSSSPSLEMLRTRIRARGRGPYAPFGPTSKAAVLAALSETDVEALEQTVRQHGRKSAWIVRNLTHQHAAWKRCWEAGEHEIDYRLFFADEPDATAVLALMEEEQDGRDVIRALERHR
ncbi:MAG: SocA family protein [Deltaproteobacteria bacterium]|nr:SocA family protein [Deltaproteobacteria bacterium]